MVAMKKIVIILSGLLTIALVLGGCSDFAFNPVGRWTFSEQRIYTDDVLTDTLPPDSGFSVALVFQKSGTGYIDSGTKTTMPFTYDYTDSTVTITRSDPDSQFKPSVYQVLNNGKELVSVMEEYEQNNEKGQVQHCRLVTVFTR